MTGGTGFLGMELIARMLDQGADGPEIVVAVRARDGRDAEDRLEAMLARLYITPPRAARRLHAVCADLTEPQLGMSAIDRRLLASEVERVIHCAASISFTLPLADARAINVDGTRGVLDLARALPRLERFVHVSTAYVAGRLPTDFSETDVGGGGFRNTYERTKMEAEVAVRHATDLPWAIVRPSIVLGESCSGWTSAFNVLYWPLQAFARGLLDAVPADPDGIVDMVPVYYVADVIEQVAWTTGAAGTFHAVAAERALTVAELVRAVCEELDRPLPELSAPGSLASGHPAAVFAPYFDVNTRFSNRRAQLLTGAPAPRPADYLSRLLGYGRLARWGKRSLSREAARELAMSVGT